MTQFLCLYFFDDPSTCFVFSFKKKIQRDVPEKYASNKGE